MRPNNQGRYMLGLDLGQVQDHSALALIEWFPVPWPAPGTLPRFPHLSVRTLKRWPMGTSYRSIIDALVQFLKCSTLYNAFPIVVADDTGVGRPVTKMVHEGLIRAGLIGGWVTATITDGHEPQHVGSGQYHVPKKVLVSVLQVLLQTRRLHVSDSLAEAPTLVRELQSFRTKITTVRADTLESWREREYDDLVLAVALAAWFAERRQDWFEDRPRREPTNIVLVT